MAQILLASIQLLSATFSGQIVLDRTAEFAKGIGGSEEKEPSETPIKPEPMETEEPVEKISDWKDVDFVTATFGEVCLYFSFVLTCITFLSDFVKFV